MSRPRISAYIIAFNEREKIEDAVGSVLWADEVVVADSGSTDGMVEAAEALGARVVQIPFEGFGKLRNAALGSLGGDWVFSLDADERCTREAMEEILRIVADPDSADIWFTPRRNWFFGRWVRFSGWYPNYRQPQLFRRGSMRYDELPVHEGWIAAPGTRVARMKAAIWQIPFRDIAEQQRKALRYSSLGAEKLRARGVPSGILLAFARAKWSFLKHYIFKLGFLDGRAGFLIALGAFEGTFYRHAKHLEASAGLTPPRGERLTRPR